MLNLLHLPKSRYMTLLIVYGVLSICFSFLCSILEAVLLSVTPTYVTVKMNEGKSYAKTLKKLNLCLPYLPITKIL